MKPSIHAVLDVLMERIRDDALPALPDGYASKQLQLGLQLLQSVADGLDDAAAWRVAEIRSLRGIFASALPGVLDNPTLAAALVQAVGVPEFPTPNSFTMTALDGQLDTLRALLVSLHTWSEISPQTLASTVNQSIWKELRQSTERRKLSVARF